MKKPIYFIKCFSFLTTLFCVPFNILLAQVTTAVATISIKTEQNRPVKNVDIAILSDDTTAAANGKTNTEGNYALPVLDNSIPYKITANKTDEAYVGVTTFDIAVLIRHIQGIETIKSPYTMIAADVDENGEVDGSDIVFIRNFILRKTPSLPKHIWRFVDKNYVFLNPTSPLGEPYPEFLNYSDVIEKLKGEFVGIKMGDVSSGLTPQSKLINGDDDGVLLTRQNRALELYTDDIQVVAGKEYTVPFSAENFSAMAYQFSLGFKANDATIVGIEMGNLNNLSTNNFNILNNTVATSWDGTANSPAPHLFNLHFIARKSGKLSETLSINDNPTRAVAFDTNGNPMPVKLAFVNDKNAGGAFTLEQNYPNTVVTTTTIPFNLPSECHVKLTIFDAQGRTLKTISNHFQAGYNEFKLNREDLQATGVIHYRLDASAINSPSEHYSATRKMVVVR